MGATEIARASGVQAGLAGATRVRWAQIAPTLLIVWIVSMFDKANMSIVQNNQDFLSQLGLNGQQARIGLLSTGLLLAYELCAPLWGWPSAASARAEPPR